LRRWFWARPSRAGRPSASDRLALPIGTFGHYPHVGIGDHASRCERPASSEHLTDQGGERLDVISVRRRFPSGETRIMSSLERVPNSSGTDITSMAWAVVRIEHVCSD
jgi:hypothetical protein